MTNDINFIAKSKDIFGLESWEELYKLVMEKHRRYDEFSEKLEDFLIKNFGWIKNDIERFCEQPDFKEENFPKVRVVIRLNQELIILNALTEENKESLITV